MATVAFHTLGCKVNFYDTEGIWQMFKGAGYTQVPFEDVADVYVINTCSVTNTGDKKSRQMIRRAVRTNPDSTVVVTGCYAQVAPAEIAAIAGVDLVVGNDRKTQIVDLVHQVRDEQQPYPEDIQSEQSSANQSAYEGEHDGAHQGTHEGAHQMVGNILKTRDFEEMDVPFFEDRTRANLKIQDGCNNFCTFCIIPYARGLIRSRKPENIVAQARKLAAAGYREIILTGIHTGGYGADLNGYRLAHLLEDLENIEGLHRVRISSIEASEIDDYLIEVLGRSTKVCKHLHIPLQAGHDQVLKRMNRHYTVEEFGNKLAKLRQALPEVAITSDVIVGFPGETDEFFDATEAFIAEQQFAQLHVFPYSPKKGTPAAKFKDQVPEEVKELRVHRLINLSNKLTTTYAQTFEGKVLEVIPEEPLQLDGQQPGQGPDGQPGYWVVGHADNYLRVAFPIPKGTAVEHIKGEVCLVQVTETGHEIQSGTLIRQITDAEIPVFEDHALPRKRGQFNATIPS